MATKKLNYEIIPEGHTAYNLLHDSVRQWHEDLRNARIGLAWRKNRKPDVDGNLVLGECVPVSDLQKEFIPLDFIIVLNREVWEHREFGDKQKVALIDHELCHAAPRLDETLEQVYDEKGSAVWRTRKHDVEEFREVVHRHGTYKADLVLFAEALLKDKTDESKEPPMPPMEEERLKGVLD